MARRISWSFLFGLGAGLVLLGVVARGRRRRAGRHAPLPREPEVVRGTGPTPVEAGLERPVASAFPDLVPDRSLRPVPPPRASPPPESARFEPVVPDAPEERDPALEPHGADPNAPAGPVPPRVRRHH